MPAKRKDLTADCEVEAFPRTMLSVEEVGVWVSLGGLMVTDHVEFGPLAKGSHSAAAALRTF